jgi:hypothetical protein
LVREILVAQHTSRRILRDPCVVAMGIARVAMAHAKRCDDRARGSVLAYGFRPRGGRT